MLGWLIGIKHETFLTWYVWRTTLKPLPRQYPLTCRRSSASEVAKLSNVPLMNCAVWRSRWRSWSSTWGGVGVRPPRNLISNGAKIMFPKLGHRMPENILFFAEIGQTWNCGQNSSILTYPSYFSTIQTLQLISYTRRDVAAGFKRACLW